MNKVKNLSQILESDVVIVIRADDVGELLDTALILSNGELAALNQLWCH